jgi:hypothetical protein
MATITMKPYMMMSEHGDSRSGSAPGMAPSMSILDKLQQSNAVKSEDGGGEAAPTTPSWHEGQRSPEPLGWLPVPDGVDDFLSFSLSDPAPAAAVAGLMPPPGAPGGQYQLGARKKPRKQRGSGDLNSKLKSSSASAAMLPQVRTRPPVALTLWARCAHAGCRRCLGRRGLTSISVPAVHAAAPTGPNGQHGDAAHGATADRRSFGRENGAVSLSPPFIVLRCFRVECD